MQLKYSNQSLMSNDRKSYVATICHFLLVLLWIWLTYFSISFGSSADPVGSVLPRHSHSVALCSFYPVVALDSWLETKYQTGFCTFFFPEPVTDTLGFKFGFSQGTCFLYTWVHDLFPVVLRNDFQNR